MVDKEGELEIDSLGVLKEYRGRGLAREILERTEMAAAKMGKESLSLTVASINTAAISLYRKTGFENAGMISRWYVTKDERAET